MRIILWGELFWPYIGGAELFAATLMRSLRSRGYEFAVVTSHDYLDLPDEADFHGIPVHRFPFRTALAPAHAEALAPVRRRLAATLQAFAPDLIHVNGVGPSTFFCLQAIRADHVRLVVRLNREPFQHETRNTPGTLLEHALQRADWVVAVSAAIATRARQLVPDVTARTSLIYSGIDVSKEPPAPPPSDPPRLLCLGRLVHEKGFDLAIDAFATIRQRWPRARLTVAGDGPERTALQNRAAERGVAEAIDFIGWVAPDDVPQVIARATMVVIPSRAEGLPVVAIQAAAMGKPIVAARVGGLPEVVRDGETGLLVRNDDSGALGAAIGALLERPETATQMGGAAWQHARTLFDHERCMDAYDALYRRVGRSPARS
jgi:glycosyltransferase involved in cell wall biosynthesis